MFPSVTNLIKGWMFVLFKSETSVEFILLLYSILFQIAYVYILNTTMTKWPGCCGEKMLAPMQRVIFQFRLTILGDKIRFGKV